jgi:hypothetical protein
MAENLALDIENVILKWQEQWRKIPLAEHDHVLLNRICNAAAYSQCAEWGAV